MSKKFENIENIESYSKEGVNIIEEDGILVLVAAEKCEQMAKKQNYPPSIFFTPSLIDLDFYEDSWTTFNFRTLHYLDSSKLVIYSDHEGIDLSIDLIVHLFQDADGILPALKCSHPADWPYLFLAQLQRVCEARGHSPSEALSIFGIIYTGNKTDSWTNFDWVSLVHPIRLTVSLVCQKDIPLN